MKTLLDFNFLVILNLLVLLLWSVSGAFPVGDTPDRPRRSVLSIIMVLLTVIAVVIDIVFLASRIGQI
jgi:hypothetical protein